MRSAAVFALAAAGACAPVVTHGPAVEPGVVVGMTAGIPVMYCDSCTAGLAPALGYYARYGFGAREPGQPGFLLGLMVPSAAPDAPEMDAYVQLPSPGEADYGAGVLLSRRHLMPYAQVGRMREGSGWYTTQGFVVQSAVQSDIFADAPGDESGNARYWAPTLAFRRGEGSLGITLYATGMVGDYEERRIDHETQRPVDRRRALRMLSLGASMEADLSSIFKR